MKIVITSEGKAVTAKKYVDGQCVGEQTARCHPNDTFDFNVGAKLALDRLVASEADTSHVKEEPKFKVGDRVCHPKYGEGEIIVIEKFVHTGKMAIGVRFDNKHHLLHDLNGMCDDFCGWWFEIDELTQIAEKRLVYKAGDRVRAKQYWCGIGQTLRQGDVVTVREDYYEGDPWVWVTFKNGYENGFLPNFFEKVTTKFVEGDLVIGTEICDTAYGITRNGWIGEVVSVGDKYFVARDCITGAAYELDQHKFELYDRKPLNGHVVVCKSDETQFKVGDCFRVSNGKCNSLMKALGTYFDGTLYTVEQLNLVRKGLQFVKVNNR